jgi:hypothetical protein
MALSARGTKGDAYNFVDETSWRCGLFEPLPQFSTGKRGF